VAVEVGGLHTLHRLMPARSKFLLGGAH